MLLPCLVQILHSLEIFLFVFFILLSAWQFLDEQDIDHLYDLEFNQLVVQNIENFGRDL